MLPECSSLGLRPRIQALHFNDYECVNSSSSNEIDTFYDSDAMMTILQKSRNLIMDKEYGKSVDNIKLEDICLLSND